MSDQVIITAALAGSATMRSQNPNLPHTPEEFALEAERCYNEGAAIVHLHARDPQTGARSFDLQHFSDMYHAIQARCPKLILNLTTSGRTQDPPESRFERLSVLKPPLASFNTNSMNFAYVDFKTGQIRSEFIYENPFAMMIRFAHIMRENNVKPEFEIFDFGGMYNVLLLRRQNLFVEPLHFQFVFGVAGGVPFDLMNLSHVLQLLPPGATWSVCGVGRDQFRACLSAVASGGHLRVGLEDNTRMPNKELARGSWEQVQWAAQVARLAGRPVASPDEARQILSLGRG